MISAISVGPQGDAAWGVVGRGRCTSHLFPAPPASPRELMREYHPDMSADEDSTEFAIFLNEVYEMCVEGGDGGGGDV